MVPPIEDFELAWRSLQVSSDTGGWRSIAIATIGSCSLRAGLSFPEKGEALLAGFAFARIPTAEKLPDGQGFAVSRLEPRSDGSSWLALTRKSHGSPEFFRVMVADVVQALGSEPTAEDQRLLRVFLGRIRAWQEFMRKGAQALSAEAEIGLIGELTLLRAIVEAGVAAATAVDFWVGPLDAIQDFEIGPGALEVKATLSIQGFPAKFGSLEQLDDSARHPLFVAGARLRLTDSGANLPEIVGAMKQMIQPDREASRLFSERLLMAGYVDAHAELYLRRFSTAGTRVLEVLRDFPRLTRATVPLGIMRVMYEVDLDQAPGPDLGISVALQRLGAL